MIRSLPKNSPRVSNNLHVLKFRIFPTCDFENKRVRHTTYIISYNQRNVSYDGEAKYSKMPPSIKIFDNLLT